MKDFTFYAPTNIIFEKGGAARVGEVIKGYGYHKVLLHYGGGSIKRSGLYETVVRSLTQAGVAFAELGGAEPNPKVSLVRKGVELCRAEGVEMVLAVGGGSAIDSGKAIAIGTVSDVDVWDIWSGKVKATKALRTGVILTLAASGSEMSNSCVLTNEELKLKRGVGSDLNRPLFAIMDPTLTFTLPPFQTACGIVDIMMHTLERYLTLPGEAELTDRIAESVLLSVIHAGPAALKNPEDYEARSTLMWAGSLSHNTLTGLGHDSYFINHQIEHEISGMYDHVAHGAGLSVVFPAWARYVYQCNIPRFAQYAVRVMGCDMDYAHPEKTALEGIEATERFFRSLNMPVRLSELGIGEECLAPISKNIFIGKKELPGYFPFGEKEIQDILRLAL